MKHWITILIVLHSLASTAQRYHNLYKVDEYASEVNADTPDSLALKLTRPFTTELEKVRAIFTWMTQNISYNTGRYQAIKAISRKNYVDPIDTMLAWKSGDEMAAIRVLTRRLAICEDYAKLFKILCDYAGLRAEIVTGYARTGMGSGRFRCNHTWNVVMIDSVWRPIDVTWASGYINQRNEFVQHLDESYFLPSPATFIMDHYPEDLRWALVAPVPSICEFNSSPFRYKCFDKYQFNDVPRKGIIDASPGETVSLRLEVKNYQRDKNISSNPFFDSTIIDQSPQSVFLYPSIQNNTLVYTYNASDASVKWLHLFYNDDLVLRYELNVKKR